MRCEQRCRPAGEDAHAIAIELLEHAFDGAQRGMQCAARDGVFGSARLPLVVATRDIQVGRVAKLLKDRKIVLDLTDAAKRWLGRVGYDPVYGARPLKRAVQRYLQDPLAEKLLGGQIPDGSNLRIDEGDGALNISVE